VKLTIRCIASAMLFIAAVASAGQPAAPAIKQIPAPGVEVPAADKVELEAGLKELGAEIETLKKELKAPLADLLPDVEIYHKAVRTALQYNEFLDVKEIANGKAILKVGLQRAKELKDGKPAWPSATGLVVRAYVSKIDGSIQPYGMVIPPEFKPDDKPRRLDFWFHGRDEKLTELNFLTQRQKSMGEFTPAGAFVLHLYGRFCNANKFAGEVDLFEALESAKKNYPVDDNRIVVRGFSMGGAACWQFATHHAGLWAAAAPGAGFVETIEFQHLQDKLDTIPWYQKKLYHFTNSTDYAANLFNVPLVAYSGEIDKQKQAADLMEKAMAEEGMKMTHIIGPQTAHKYHPEAKIEVSKLVDKYAETGRDNAPKKVRFTTWTLRYNTMKWITIDALGKHWERARADGEVQDDGSVKMTTTNVTALTLNIPAALLKDGANLKVALDGQTLEAPVAASVHFKKQDKTWALSDGKDDGSLKKKHELQGPIDDAFMDSFVMVRPTGKALNEKTGAWLKTEMTHATEQWRRHYRGETPVIDDSALSETDIANKNLILWGDPSSNSVLAKIADKLPVKWDKDAIHAGSKTYPSESNVAVMIYPNPLNPKHYVVLNSGYTYIDNSAGSNAFHIAVLPDWAVMDVTAPRDARVKDANFFGEKWEFVEGHE